MEASKIKVLGKVQGVWFRASTQSMAQNIGLKGFVQNESDGSVLIYAFGDPDQIQQLIQWCQRGGPPHARVDKVVVESIEWQDLTDFTIKRS